MLDGQTRVVLLDQLRPPPGFGLDAAVATTFTLDLAAALVAPVAFTPFGANALHDPIATLQAVRSATDRIDLFCQAGQITVPAQASDLMAALEPMVHSVQPPKSGSLFHPKMWLLRFKDETGEIRYRLLASSRNLVSSAAWDVAVTLDGVPGRRDTSNRAIAHLLRNLPDMTHRRLEPSREARILELADEATRIQWENPPDIDLMRFHAWGLPRVRVDADFSGSRHLIVSPFLNADGLEEVTAGDRHAIVVSRAEAWDSLARKPLPKNFGTWQSWVMDPLAGFADPDTVASGPTPQGEPEHPPAAVTDTQEPAPTQAAAAERQGLHAKIYIVEQGWRSRMFVGSPNATDAALHGNVEFAVELEGRRAAVGIDRFLDPELGLGKFLQEYDPSDETAAVEPSEAELDLMHALRRLASVPITLAVQPEGPLYGLRLTSEREFVPADFSAKVNLLSLPGKVVDIHGPSAAHAAFHDVNLADITSFVCVTLTEPSGLQAGTVVPAALVNEPAGRLDQILARQIDSPEKFLHFLSLLLSLAEGSAAWALAEATTNDGPHSDHRATPRPDVLERVVAALASGDREIDAISRMVKSLSSTEEGRSRLPAGFDELWANVEQARLSLRPVGSDE